MTAATIARIANRPVILVTAHIDDADEACDELEALLGEGTTLRFPALETLPGESHVSLEQYAERIHTQRALLGGALGAGQVLVCPVQALMQAAPAPGALEALSLRLRPGDARAPDAVVRWLDGAGYERTDAVEEPGQYSVRGGILDVFPSGATALGADGRTSGSAPIRVDFFGDEIESLREFDLDTMGSDRKLQEVELVGAATEAMSRDKGAVSILECAPPGAIVIVHETMEVVEQGRGYFERVTDARSIFGPPAVLKTLQERFHAFCEVNQFSTGANPGAARFALPARALPDFSQEVSEAVGELRTMEASRRVVVVCNNDGERSRLEELRAEFAPGARFEAHGAYLHRGFLWGEDGDPGALALVPHHELLHRYDARRRVRRLRGGRAADAFVDLQPGDYVVHSEHGVARFVGLTTLKPRAPKRAPLAEEHAVGTEEYLTLEFAGRSRLHVPVSQICW